MTAGVPVTHWVSLCSLAVTRLERKTTFFAESGADNCDERSDALNEFASHPESSNVAVSLLNSLVPYFLSV